MKHFSINDSLGTATLEADGTLILMLHRNMDTRFNFSAVIRIKPDNPRYHKYINYIGGITYGERKSIPPEDDLGFVAELVQVPE